MNAIIPLTNGFFFVYKFGGTRKTFLWNALTTSLRSREGVAIIVASSGIAITLLPLGRTAHSRFVIPINMDEDSMCSIPQSSPLHELIRCAKLIIWDPDG